MLPLSTLFMACLVPLVDPPGLTSYEYTPRACAVLALSGGAAFFVNWSGFLVLGACSALTHTVLGQLKSVAVILGGWLLFAQYYPLKAVGGAAVALVAMVWYTHANLKEQQLSAGASAAAAITALATPGSSPSSSTASLEEGEVLLQSRHKRSGQGAGS